MTSAHVEIDLASVDVGTATTMPGVSIGVPGPTGPKGDKGDTGAMGPAGDENSSDNPTLGHPTKDYREPTFTGQTTFATKTGAVCIPFTFTASNIMFNAEVDLVLYTATNPLRVTVESSCYFRTSAVGASLASLARVTAHTKRAAIVSALTRPRVRWIQESDTKIWLVIGDVADVTGNEQVILRRTVGWVGPKSWAVPVAGPPEWKTVLPTPFNGPALECSVLDGTGVYYGTGAPAINADPGAKYIDLAATFGAVEWTKLTGTGITGWAVTVGDTGWRNVNTLLVAGAITAGTVAIRRRNNRVTFYLSGVQLAAGTGALQLWAAIPVGWRPHVNVGVVFSEVAMYRNNNTTLRQAMVAWSDLYWNCEQTLTSGSVTLTRPGVPIQGQASWENNEAWPTSLIGVPA